jgi:plastocyanin
VPDEVLLNFNFDVRDPSYIKVTKDGTDATDGSTVIGDGSLSMRVPVKKGFGDGEYVVNYHACWPDRSCHDGSFGFIVDSNFKSQMTDLTGQASVTINLQDISFSPRYVRVSQGTKVTFVNNDNVEHFINTDPHPSHNYVPELNSRGFSQGGSAEFTFDDAGEIHYHCSAHENLGMDAIILVE